MVMLEKFFVLFVDRKSRNNFNTIMYNNLKNKRSVIFIFSLVLLLEFKP